VIRSSWAVHGTIDQEDARMFGAAAFMPGLRPAGVDQPIARAGFRPGYGGVTPGKVAAASSQSVTIQPFQLVLPSRRGATSGGAYLITSDEVITLDGLLSTPPHPTYSRIDLIVVQQNDTFYGDNDSLVTIKQIVGTPASPPSPPTVTTATGSPADYFVLGQYTLPPGSSADLRNVTITPTSNDAPDSDRFTVASGGILPVPTTAARSLLTAKGWAGLTVYNREAAALQTLSGMNGQWKTLWDRVPAQITSTIDPAAVPVKIDGTLYAYGRDLYLYKAGAMLRLTWNEIDMGWKDTTWAGEMGAVGLYWPYVRLINSDTCQMAGQMQKDYPAENIPNGTQLLRLPTGYRPATLQTVAVACEFANDYSTTAKISIMTDGKVYFYCPDELKAKWVSFDGVIYALTEINTP
jgi:hypothetical protein